MLQRIGITPRTSREFETADGRLVARDIAVAMMRLEGETLPTLVVFADPGDSVLLGVYSLEGFGLGVDQVQKRLIPVRGLAMGRRALP